MKNKSKKVSCIIGIIPVMLLLTLLPINSTFADPPLRTKNTYFLDPVPIAKTPKILGANVEVMQYAGSANIWDWLSYSGVGMVRVGHPDQTFRKKETVKKPVFESIKTKADFENYRKGIISKPEKNINWENYLFAEEIPWLGTPDSIMDKLNECNIAPILSMAYHPKYYPASILLNRNTEVIQPDENINWSAAASAYEYYFACMYRYSMRNRVIYYMMLNEPFPTDKQLASEVGVLSKIARLALEDIRSLLPDKEVASKLQLSGPAMYLGWEEYFPYVKQNVDFLDVHLYEPDDEIFARKLSRAMMRARLSGTKLALTEFNRVGGPMLPEESLFGLKASFQLISLMMKVLAASDSDDPLLEMALVYEFQFPATHRNYKSLLYGDMNYVDWTGRDKGHWHNSSAPTFEELQLRHVTPAFDLVKMLTRCTPGAASGTDYFEVLELGEANRGVSAVRDSISGRNLYPLLERDFYYAMGGGGAEIKTLVVKGNDRLYINILNPGPKYLEEVGFDISNLNTKYKTAVVRETSMIHRDEPVSQQTIKNDTININIPPESFTQIICTREDLTRITELKIDEQTVTPGNLEKLNLFQTTILNVYGKIGSDWIDVSDLNVKYEVSKNSGLTVYQGGLLQRVKEPWVSGLIGIKTLDNLSLQLNIGQ